MRNVHAILTVHQASSGSRHVHTTAVCVCKADCRQATPGKPEMEG